INADSSPSIAHYRAVKDMHLGINAGDAGSAAVLNGDGVKVNTRIVINKNAASTVEGDVVAERDPLRAGNVQGAGGWRCRLDRSTGIAKNREVCAIKDQNAFRTGSSY